MDKILNDRETYKLLNPNPIRKFKKELEVLIYYGVRKGISNKHEEKYLVPTSCKTPVIYYIPKIHKDKTSPPGRPIVSGIESLTARLGENIDLQLQPLMRDTLAYLRVKSLNKPI